MKRLKVGMLLFPDITIQDFVGPYEVFIKAPCFEVLIIGESTDLLQAEGGLFVKANLTLKESPALDIVFIPGGKGINSLLTNTDILNFLRKQAGASYFTSVCTGSLVLAAAGLLDGYRATTHWRSIPLLKMFGIEVEEKRVVVDRNRITGGGVTAGIDFGLLLTAIIGGEDMAKSIQLMLEYNPEPPFNAGTRRTIEENLLEQVIETTQPMFALRQNIIRGLVEEIS